MSKNLPILENLNTYEDFKNIDVKLLPALANEMRSLIIDLSKKKNIHLASNLGIVEVTLALGKVFDLDKDLVFFDTGHQSYVYKIITGRKDKIASIRDTNGLYGLQNMKESKYDYYSGGHSGNSLSVASGYLESLKTNKNDLELKLNKIKNLLMRYELDKKRFNKISKLDKETAGTMSYVVPVIGDAAIANGVAMEALNDISFRNSRPIIILNDNEMSISESVGSIPRAISNIKTNPLLSLVEKTLYVMLWNTAFGKKVYSWLYKTFHSVGKHISGSNIFSALGYQYIGPIDGHKINKLIQAMNKAKWYQKFQPVILHVKTQKGKGLDNALDDKVGLNHSSNIDNSQKLTGEYISEYLLSCATKNNKLKVINPAMTYNSGFLNFSRIVKDNYFDVGISEEHALSFASGLAIKGMSPVVVIYSTFLQRAYDQLVHDFSRLDLGLTLLIDRAEISGGDGDSHHGIFDVGFLKTVPNTIITSPSSITEAKLLVHKSLNTVNKIFCIRYPKKLPEQPLDEVEFEKLSKAINNFEWTNVCESQNNDKVIVTYGNWVNKFKQVIEQKQLPIDLVNAIYINQYNEKSIHHVLKKYKTICVFEEIYENVGLANDFMIMKNDSHNLIIKNIKRFPGAGNNRDVYANNHMDVEQTIKEIMQI